MAKFNQTVLLRAHIAFESTGNVEDDQSIFLHFIKEMNIMPGQTFLKLHDKVVIVQPVESEILGITLVV